MKVLMTEQILEDGENTVYEFMPYNRKPFVAVTVRYAVHDKKWSMAWASNPNFVSAKSARQFSKAVEAGIILCEQGVLLRACHLLTEDEHKAFVKFCQNKQDKRLAKKAA